MPSKFEGTFEQSRHEWTIRKHRILTHYFHVAAAMLKEIENRLAFVEGFAGANQYGDEASGSTRIMIEKALKAQEQWGTEVQVHACESDVETFKHMCDNLRAHIDSGLLRVYNKPHSEAIIEIQSQTTSWPTIVFLDPNRPTQMTIKEDISPWAGLHHTDILGLYFGQSVHRIVKSAKKVQATQKTASAIAGEDWDEISSEKEAYNQFLLRIKALAPRGFAGMYQLWKKDEQRIAYGIFGISGHIKGYWLLSDAVARDHSRIDEFKRKESQEGLFANDPEYNTELKKFNRLIEVSRAVLVANPTLKGKQLGQYILREYQDAFFGQYAERDYNRAIRVIREDTI